MLLLRASCLAPTNPLALASLVSEPAPSESQDLPHLLACSVMSNASLNLPAGLYHSYAVHASCHSTESPGVSGVFHT